MLGHMITVFNFLRTFQTILAVFTAHIFRGHSLNIPKGLGGEHNTTTRLVPGAATSCLHLRVPGRDPVPTVPEKPGILVFAVVYRK